MEALTFLKPQGGNFMVINHNIEALNTYGRLNANTANGAKSLEKLSSGLRINKAGDDAAGLAISEKMRAQVRGLDQASRNAQDGISMIQTAEGALNETHSILQRMRELSNQAANGTNTDSDRGALQDELNQLTSEINRVGNTTEFNTQKLLNGGIGSGIGDKITKATSATLTGACAAGFKTSCNLVGCTLTAKIKVDGQTFDISTVFTCANTSAYTSAQLVSALGNVSSGGTKLSDLVTIACNSTGTGLTFTAKSTGLTSCISITTCAGGKNTCVAKALGLAAAGATYAAEGTASTVERAGLQAATAINASFKITQGDSFQIKIGNETCVTVTFDNTKTYSSKSSTACADLAADFVKDLNAALQKAGLDGKVSASLSQNNKVQLISETGKDLAIYSPSTSLSTVPGITTTLKPQNVQQVIGPGAAGSGFTTKFQIGANKGQSMELVVNDMRSAALGVTGNAGQVGYTKTNTVTNGTDNIKAEAALDITTASNASKSLAIVDKAIASVSAERAKLGSVQNRLEHTINNLGTSSENLTAAESRIRDVDMAKEMMNFTKNNILTQAAQSMLAQANQAPQGVLQLLR